MASLKKALRLRDGIALALGSIAGSGILFLPSLTYAIGGPDVLLIWLGGTLLCFPLLFLFADMVRAVPDGSGIEGFVARGLGPRAAASVPILFLALVAIGVPAASLVAGEYLRQATGGNMAMQMSGALIIIVTVTAINLAGIRASTIFQNTAVWALMGVAALLGVLTYPEARGHYDVLRPQFVALAPILKGIVVAFWAYAGFENMTFIAGEFKNPRRDFFAAMLVAFVIYGGLAVVLTANIAALIPRAELSPVAGLFQLANRIPPTAVSIWVITVFALALLLVNINSWMWGMSRLVYASADAGRLPRYFARLESDGVPRRAVTTLGFAFVVVAGLFVVFPWLLVEALVVASTVFMFVNVLCLVSYLVSERRSWKTIVAGGLLVFLVAMLFNTGLRALYPLGVFCAAVAASARRQARRPAERLATRVEAPAADVAGAAGPH